MVLTTSGSTQNYMIGVCEKKNIIFNFYLYKMTFWR